MLYRRYPLSYETALGDRVEEGRNEVSLYWRVLENKTVTEADLLEATDRLNLTDGVELSVNWRNFDPLESTGTSGDEAWVGLGFAKSVGTRS